MWYTAVHWFEKDVLVHMLNFIHNKIDEKIVKSIYQLLEPFSKLELTEFYMIQLLRAAI